MILLVGPAAGAHVDVVPEGVDGTGDIVRAETVENAADALATGEVSVLVLDLSVSGADDLFERLRAEELGSSDTPVVLLADGDPAVDSRSFDTTLRKPVDDEAFAAALERAAAVTTYRDAVETLYERCRERAASGMADPLTESADLSAAREEADRALDALEDPGVVADLLGRHGECLFTPEQLGEWSRRSPSPAGRAARGRRRARWRSAWRSPRRTT